jgi:uracil-DNA glycosylase family 4
MNWNALNQKIVTCTRCPRLRQHCQNIAHVRRAAYAQQQYWGKPVPNLAPPDLSSVRLLIVGLAPGAHGANRTGRLFTGDRSGDFLFRAMHQTGFVSQPTSVAAGDGLELIACAITGICHCAPPDNKPTNLEIANCQGFLDQTLALLEGVRGVVALGKLAFEASVAMLERAGHPMGRPRPKFAHAAVAWSDNHDRFLIASYHPSQQNTFTGKLTPAMLRAVFRKAKRFINPRNI